MPLPAFSHIEFQKAHQLLASRVAIMQGRKFEEGDWAYAYCGAKGIPNTGWSNLNIDVMHNGLGVEHKMMCVRKKPSIKEYCGTTLMHPAATRSIRVGGLNRDPNDAARDILEQYAALIRERKEKVTENNTSKNSVDMRTGWLLWQLDLDEFLYFEEPMVEPCHSNYVAEWNERPARGARKPTKNLWIYEKSSGKKRFSVTTEAGAKIQPYFDIPLPTASNLYVFRVQGEPVEGNKIRIWVTRTTALCLSAILGDIDNNRIDAELRRLSEKNCAKEPAPPTPGEDLAIPILISEQGYSNLRSKFVGVSDEHLMQQFAQFLFQKVKR